MFFLYKKFLALVFFFSYMLITILSVILFYYFVILSAEFNAAGADDFILQNNDDSDDGGDHDHDSGDIGMDTNYDNDMDIEAVPPVNPELSSSVHLNTDLPEHRPSEGLGLMYV